MSGIEKASIPDEDIPGWIEALKKGGDMTQEEIDGILSHLNTSYARALNPNWLEETIDHLDSLYFTRTKQRLTEEHRAHIREKLQTK